MIEGKLVLTDTLKRRILHEIERCFRKYYPNHEDILDHVDASYPFKHRAQKGIVLSNSGADPMQLSADHFQATVESHVMLAEVGREEAKALEWVRETPETRGRRSGDFPARPGVYYIEIVSKERLKNQIQTEDEFQTTLDQQGDHDFYFYVDPLIQVRQEPVLHVTDGNESSSTLMRTPILEGSHRLYENGYELTYGPYLEVEATESLAIETGAFLGLPDNTRIQPVSVSAETAPFDVDPGYNDHVVFWINGTRVETTLDGGFYTADEMRQSLLEACRSAGLSYDEYTLTTTDQDAIQIEADQTLRFASDTTSRANLVFGWEEGFIPPQVTGDVFTLPLQQDRTFQCQVNGTTHEVTLHKRTASQDAIATAIENAIGSDVTVRAHKGGEYEMDHQTGDVTFHKSFKTGTKIAGDYLYPDSTRGPFGIEPNHADTDAIPGTVLAFGKRLEDGNRMAVVVHEQRKGVAKEYGGRYEQSLDIEVITRDPETRSEIGDALTHYFNWVRREDLTEEGIEITDVSYGGESEEMYEDTTQTPYFLGSVSLSVQTDWAVYVPKPYTVERISPVSADQEAAQARVDDSDRTDAPDNVDTSSHYHEQRIRNMYHKEGLTKFETIY